MTDRGKDLRQLGALAEELCEAGDHEAEGFVEYMIHAGTFDLAVPGELIEHLRKLWEASETKRNTTQSANAGESRDIRLSEETTRALGNPTLH